MASKIHTQLTQRWPNKPYCFDIFSLFDGLSVRCTIQWGRACSCDFLYWAAPINCSVRQSSIHLFQMMAAYVFRADDPWFDSADVDHICMYATIAHYSHKGQLCASTSIYAKD